MKHNISFLAVALIVVSLIFGTSAFQGQGKDRAQSARCCSPRAQDLVSRDGKVEFVQKKPIVPIYKVPANKWFILTDLHLEHDNRSGSGNPSLIQRKDGKDLERIFRQFLWRSTWKDKWAATGPLGNPTTGLAFPPKSLVMLSAMPSASNAIKYAFHMRGYLTDQ